MPLTDRLGSTIDTYVDIEAHEQAILGMAKQKILKGEKVGTHLFIHREIDPVVAVVCRPVTSREDSLTALNEMLFLLTAIEKHTGVMVLDSSVILADTKEELPSISIIAFTENGIMSISYAYRVNEDNTDVEWVDEATRVEGDTYPPEKENTIIFFNRLRKPMYPPSYLIKFLRSKGHDVKLYDGWTVENIDGRTGNYFHGA